MQRVALRLRRTRHGPLLFVQNKWPSLDHLVQRMCTRCGDGDGVTSSRSMHTTCCVWDRQRDIAGRRRRCLHTDRDASASDVSTTTPSSSSQATVSNQPSPVTTTDQDTKSINTRQADT
jgi:hypothetical protein